MQRYERDMSLPVLRPAGKSAAAVTAIRTDLDNWVTTPRPRVRSLAKRRALKSRTNELRAKFLQIDSEIALTFANLALTASDPQKRNRTSQVAREAYDTIMRLREETDVSDAKRDKLDANLRRLKRELQSLGQCF